MDEPVTPTAVFVGDLYGQKKVANLTIENARFWGRPNFNGDLDRFKDSSRKFTIIIPNELADDLRNLGWNVKTQVKTPEGEEVHWNLVPSFAALANVALNPDQEVISSLKVKVDMSPEKDLAKKGSKVWITTGPGVPPEQLNSATAGLLDRSRVTQLDLELRAWEYDPEDEPGKYSARLVECVATVQLNRIAQKYGRLGGAPSTIVPDLEPAQDSTP